MLASFEKLVGAAGDVRELEYISALHQTDSTEVRKDASIKAEDIRLFLCSRYGILVDDEKVKTTILSGLGGGSEEDDVLDLMEVVAILLIPVFLKAVAQNQTDKSGHLDNNQKEGPTDNNDSENEEVWEDNQHQNALPGDVIPTPPGLLDYVLKMILGDVTGDSSSKTLSPDLIRRILVAYGEYQLAEDDKLVDEMYQAATAKNTIVNTDSSTTTPTVLSVETFGEALTHDIGLYDIRNETRLTTNFDDVYVTEEDVEEKEEEMLGTVTNDEELVRAHRETQNLRQKLAVSEVLDRVNTIPSIDITAGTYRSKGLIVLLWSTILITYFAYFTSFDRGIEEACAESEEYAYEYNSPWSENGGAMLCESFVSIVNWLFFFGFMSIFGIVCVSLGSIGNNVDCKTPWKPLLGMTFVFLLVAVPYAFSRNSEREENNILYVASLVLGLITSAFHLCQAVALYVSPQTMHDLRAHMPKLHPFISTIAEEQAVKRATAKKLSMMTNNALVIARSKETDSMLNHYGQALKSYETKGKRFESAGGFLWAWRRHFGRAQEFADEGIWIPSRMIASNIAQYVVAVYILIGGLFLTDHVANEYDKEWAKRQFNNYVDRFFDTNTEDEVADAVVANVTTAMGQYLAAAEANGVDFGCNDFSMSTSDFIDTYCGGDSMQCDTSADVNYLCPFLNSDDLDASSQTALLNASGFDQELVRQAAYQAAQQAADDTVDSLFPSEKYMIVVPMYVGTFLAFLIALSLALIYIPSVTSTMLKLRCGVIPTLRDKDYNRYRCAPDQVALLTGSLFWGSLFSSIVVGGSIGLIVFFFLWQASVYYAQRLVAILIGMLSVLLVRLAIVCSCRCIMYKGFYRVKPRPANITILALEWGNFALSAGYILARSIKLLLAAAGFIGRIDTPFLAHNVGRIGPMELDNYPMVHTKDVLSHEAHRHPYIEQLGVMYLMKLRYSNHFGQRAGVCWRLIFVHALMPWLHKYRIQARHDRDGLSMRQQKLLDVKKQFPSLHFVSLHHLDTTDLEASDENESEAHNPHSERPGDQTTDVDLAVEKSRRIRELEQEVHRLREMLAESAVINPTVSC